MLDIDDLADVFADVVKSATAPLLERIAALEARQPEKGEKGDCGEQGPQGETGPQGEQGIRGERGADGATGADGRDGKDGETGPQGKQGKEGPQGRDGRDGQPGRDGKDGGKGIDGKDGVNGLDGFGFDDLAIEYDGERALTVRFVQGERVKEFPLTIPIQIDRGIYRPGTFQKGDGVTFGGSYWIANCDTDAKPSESDDWRLAVRKGRDGKDAK